MKKTEKKSGLWTGLNDRFPLPGIGLACAGILMMAYGISRGEMSVVFDKAVRICMECIGIG